MSMYSAAKNSHVNTHDSPSTTSVTIGVRKLSENIDCRVVLSMSDRPPAHIIITGRMSSMAV